MRKWRKLCCTPQSLLRNKKITSASRLKALSKVGTTVFKFQGSFDGVVAGSVFEAYLPDCKKKVDLGKLSADRARVRDDPA